MQLGPDAIHMLRCISKQHTGDRYAYDAARVQRNRFGGASSEIDFDNLEHLDPYHPDSYGVFMKHRVLPQAIKHANRLKGADPSLVKHTMAILLKRALTEDTEVYWQLSSHPLRSILFPASYTDGKRSDRIFYYDTAAYRNRLGRALWLRGFSPKEVQQFHLKAAAIVPSKTLDLDLITPLKNKQEGK